MKIFAQLVVVALLIGSCNGQSNQMKKHQHTNALVNETSPYLLQHAHNPVDWHPWNKETLDKAEREGKLLLISIGYSACHWCHVMEHESFEDEEVAKLMNEHFINIKVDREERPDVDQVYMNAVQLMQQRGGWPLNCIALPDGRPVWGGTYFPKEKWMQQIQEVSDFYINKPEAMIEYAEKLTQGIQQSELIRFNSNEAEFKWDDLHQMVTPWAKRLDNIEGGSDKSPKFPIPNNYIFLMRYAHLDGNSELHKHIQLTLEKMAFGGIYDQVGGGFARYSTDKLWKAPHFEKMLYDNAQLVSLYSEAYLAYNNPMYQEIVSETLEFVERELMSTEGAFYSALDADSEGEEGKFYVWKKEELQTLLGADFKLFASYYNINNKGLWEHENYILLKTETDKSFAEKHSLSLTALQSKVNEWKDLLLEKRAERIRPGLDDKSLTSWNALMCRGFADAYMTFNNDHYLEVALKNAQFIMDKQWQKDGALLHSYKDGRSTINGYLEDYAFTIEAFIRLYEVTFDKVWLERAEKLVEYSAQHFLDSESGMFFFTSDLDDALVARKMEVNDNVIPASCSAMANNLFLLSHYLDKSSYKKMASTMLNNVKEMMPQYGSAYSNWGILLLNQVVPFYEVAIVGSNSLEKAKSFNQEYHPNKLLIGSSKESDLALLEGKYVEGSTTIYVCVNKACQLPTTNVDAALKLVQ